MGRAVFMGEFIEERDRALIWKDSEISTTSEDGLVLCERFTATLGKAGYKAMIDSIGVDKEPWGYVSLESGLLVYSHESGGVLNQAGDLLIRVSVSGASWNTHRDYEVLKPREYNS